MNVYFAMFSFWKIMVVCSNHQYLCKLVTTLFTCGKGHWNNHAEPFEWDILLVNC